jgi:hypothetical protein
MRRDWDITILHAAVWPAVIAFSWHCGAALARLLGM